MWKILGAMLLAAPQIGHAQAVEPFTYKGVQLGESIESFKIKLPDYACKETSCTYSRETCQGSSLGILDKAVFDAYVKRGDECRARTSFGGAMVTYGSATFHEGKLDALSLSMPSPHADKLGEVLAGKYGQPSAVDTTPFRNKLGAEIPNWAKSWDRQGERLTVLLRSGRVEDGIVLLESSSSSQRRADARKKNIEAGAKDF